MRLPNADTDRVARHDQERTDRHRKTGGYPKLERSEPAHDAHVLSFDDTDTVAFVRDPVAVEVEHESVRLRLIPPEQMGDAASEPEPPQPDPTAAPVEPSAWARLVQRAGFDLAQLNKLIVTSYKVVGFAILTAILLGLVSYLGLNLFYLVTSSWVEPVIVSPTDEHVLALNAQMAEQAGQRDRLTAQRGELAANLQDALRTVAMNQQFQASYKSAVRADLSTRQSELVRLRGVTGALSGAKGEIQKANRAFAGVSRKNLDDMYKAHVIDRETYLAENYQLSQMAHANLALSQSEVQLTTQRDELARDAAGLSALDGDTRTGRLSYDALRARQEYDRSLLDEAKARDQAKAYQASLAGMDQTIARYDRTIASIKASPYIRAVEEKVTVGFVPYENQDNVKPGAPLYACWVGPLFCHRVGRVVEVLAGETTYRHPIHNTMPRGVMVRLELTASDAAEQKVLYAGHRPLLF